MQKVNKMQSLEADPLNQSSPAILTLAPSSFHERRKDPHHIPTVNLSKT